MFVKQDLFAIQVGLLGEDLLTSQGPDAIKVSILPVGIAIRWPSRKSFRVPRSFCFMAVPADEEGDYFLLNLFSKEVA